MDKTLMWRSRKIVIWMIQVLMGLIGLIVSYFIDDPQIRNLIFGVYVSMSFVEVALILAIAIEDSAAFGAGAHPTQTQSGDTVGKHSITVGSVQTLTVDS